jgi:hypothetical protein
MAIPESQLETWSHQGSITQSSTTYGTVKRALEADDTKYANQAFKVFLQGSYGNDTNIYAESDVDIVIRLDSTYHFDISALSLEQQAAFNQNTANATYTYATFKSDVASALTDRFGDDVDTSGKKAIKIKAGNGRRSSDVVVATQFRRYRSFSTWNQTDYETGICFFTSSWERVVNYPNQHSANCTAKHQATKSWFKPTVRILKNIRSKLAENGVLEQSVAPSYFIEGLLYNVPTDKFGGTYEGTVVESINWIVKADRSKFVCANEQYYLLGTASAVQWPATNCDKFLDGVVALWKEWK